MTDRYLGRYTHGASAYGKGCRCDVCRAYNSRATSRYQRERRFLEGRDVFIPSTPTALRLRALASAGWSPEAIAERSGLDRTSLRDWRSGTTRHVRRSTHRAVAMVYRELAMTPGEGRSATHTRAHALRQGWPTPIDLNEEGRIEE